MNKHAQKKYILRLSKDISKIARMPKIDLQNHNRLQEYTIELHSELLSILKSTK